MQPRQQVTDQFSTFLRFADDRTDGWAIDPRLRRSMQIRMNQLQQFDSEAFWSTYWHRHWLAAQAESDDQPPNQHLAQSHLSAYLQEPCYWATQSLRRRLAQSDGILAECFQIAIARVPKVLRACDPNHTTSLKTYSKTAFENIIRDGLRQQYQINRCNDWALLLRVSTRQVREALRQAGLSSQQTELYLNAYQCYENACWQLKSARQRIDRPDAAGWQILVDCYRQQYPQQSINASQIEARLVDCAAQVRAYLYPAVVSLNAPRSEQSGEWQDDLPTSQNEPMAELIAQEEQSQRQIQQAQLNQVLTAAIARLEPQMQTLLALYYQQHLTQQQIAEALNLQQYAVSRRLTKAREKLLLALAEWQQAQAQQAQYQQAQAQPASLHNQFTSTVIKSISALLEEWLHYHYATSDAVAASLP